MRSVISVRMLKSWSRWNEGESCGFTPAELKRIPEDCYEIIPPSGGESSDMSTIAPAKPEAESPTFAVAALPSPPRYRSVQSPQNKRVRRKS